MLLVADLQHPETLTLLMDPFSGTVRDARERAGISSGRGRLGRGLADLPHNWRRLSLVSMQEGRVSLKP